MKTLLVLTGHSKGLGKAILEKFLKEEDVRILAISRSALKIQKDNLKEIPLDLSDLDRLVEQLPTIFPKEGFDRKILINNAGWIGEVKPVGKLSPQGIQQVMNLNLLAPMILVDGFAKAYRDEVGQKIIVNISSGAAYKSIPGWSEYCTGKAGLAMFSQIAAEELKGKGIRVFSLAPGIVDTEMQAEIRKAEQEDFPSLERFKSYKTTGQLSSAEEVARKIHFLINHPERFEDVVQDVRDFQVG
jgi:benzil reductase ((S)-benzoin forming)